MAGAGYKLFNTGDVLTAAQVNTYLQEQVVMVFANAAARTTALSGVVAEGMVSFLKDTDSLEIYSGTAWVAYGSGDITGVTAGTGLSGGGTSGSVTLSLSTPVTETNGGTNQTTYTTGDILYASGSNTLAKRNIGTSGQVLTVSGGVPTWASPTSSTLPAFRAYGANQQSFTANTWTKVTYDTEVFDTDNKYASNRFTPGVAGYYYVSARMQAASGSNNSCFVAIYKNGVNNTQDATESNPYASGNPNAIIYLSATDYVEVYALINFSGGNSNGDNNLYFSAAGIRS